MQNENPVLKGAMKEASKLGHRLFRNNRGMFLTLDGKRKVRAGLEAEGSSDLIGPIQVTVTPEMVGMKIAIFGVVETKHEGWVYKGTPHERKQKNFLDFVDNFGGIAFFLSDSNRLSAEINSRISSKILNNLLDRQKKNV